MSNTSQSNNLTRFYIICGCFGLLCIILFFVPVFRISFKSGSFEMIFAGSGLKYENTPIHNLIFDLTRVFTILSVVALAVWAVLSFMYKAASGVFGIIGSVLYAFVSLFWVFHITSNISDATRFGFKPNVFVPFLMLAAAVISLILSVIQLIKRKKLHLSSELPSASS